MLKVLKFGGSSMASAEQYAKVKAIVEEDSSRAVVVVSAAGKRNKDDHKITDLLYLCHAHMKYGVSCDSVFGMISRRYLEIRDALGLKTDLEAALDKIRADMENGMSEITWVLILWTPPIGCASAWTARWISSGPMRPCGPLPRIGIL